MLAAVMVIFGHSFDILNQAQAEPLLRLSRGVIATHNLAVVVFFVISGFLVTKSWMTRPNPISFLVSRGLRIMPALVVVVAVSAAVLGLVVTTNSKLEYITNQQTLWYIVSNATLFFGQQGTLPGVFLHQAVGPEVNASLWTLPYEVFCYGLVLLMGLAGSKRHPKFVSALWVIATLLILIPFNLSLERGLSENVFRFFLAFALGSACYCWGLHTAGRKFLRIWIAAIAWVAFFLLAPSSISEVLLALAVPYTVLTLAYSDLGSLIANVGRAHDLSYGTYLYAFPIQQLVVGLLNGQGEPIAVFLISLPCTLVCAYLSWTFVEAPALRLKDRWRGGSEGEIRAPSFPVR